MATNIEVFWPDGRSVARPLEPSEINSVLEIDYPRDKEDVTPTVEIQVQCSTFQENILTRLFLVWLAQMVPFCLAVRSGLRSERGWPLHRCVQRLLIVSCPCISQENKLRPPPLPLSLR